MNILAILFNDQSLRSGLVFFVRHRPQPVYLRVAFAISNDNVRHHCFGRGPVPVFDIGIAKNHFALAEIDLTTIPAPVSFRGMPAPRVWEFEDAQVDFAVDAGPTDLGRMLLVEFALNSGNDWFVIPVELGVGSFYRTKSLVITDTFGERTLINATSELGESHSN